MHPWNRGLTKETDKRVAAISNKLTGRPRNKESVRKAKVLR